jgi:2-polyprenyl-3-methyl-5-hydroxy-6-metoxy-1,4-benzoquinol methylase
VAFIRTEYNDLLPGRAEIRSRPDPSCTVCGSLGVPLYVGLRDKLFEAPGTWSLNRCANGECGLVWLDPKPLEEDIGKAYEGYYTHQPEVEAILTPLQRAYRVVKDCYIAFKYSYSCGLSAPYNVLLGTLMYFDPGRRADLDFSVFYLDSKPQGQLLDIGCGSGILLKGLQNLEWNVQGVDFDADAVRNARSKGLKVHLGHLAEQKFPDNSFDAVTMSHLIEHVSDPVALLRECKRILKPAGQLVIVTPNANSWGHRLYGANWRGLEPPRHIHIFTSRSLKNVLREAGFEQVFLSTTVRAANFYFIASHSLRRTGKHEMGSRPSRGSRFWGKAMQSFEWARLKLDREAGEEIAAIAQK